MMRPALIVLLAFFTSGCASAGAWLAPLTTLQQFSIDDATHARDIAGAEGRHSDEQCLKDFIALQLFVQKETMGPQGIFTAAQINKSVSAKLSTACMMLVTQFR